MKIASLIARYLMGLGFIVFGLNGFLQFLPQQPIAEPALSYVMLLSKTHYLFPVCALQLIGGLLLVINRYVPLALTILAPILVNILIFHMTMQPAGLAPGLLFVVFWFLVFSRVRSAFDGILENRPAN